MTGEFNDIYCMPVVPMRGVVAFPNTNLNFDAGRDVSIKAVESAYNDDGFVFLAAQKKVETEKPKTTDIYTVGTVAKINQFMRMPGNVVRVVVSGVARGIIREFTSSKPFMKAVVEVIDDVADCDANEEESYIRILRDSYQRYFENNPRLNPEGFAAVMDMNDMCKMCDTISAGIDFKIETKQELLEEFDVCRRIEKLATEIENHIMVIRLERSIAKRVKESMDKNQREYYLREQMKVIQEELGDSEGIRGEAAEYRKKIKKAKISKEGEEKLLKEVDRFEKMPASTADSAVVRNYLDTVLAMPWNKKTKEEFDINNAKKILDEDHFGLEKVKERIVEYLAVRHFTKGKNGTVLCLVGPPGVGKTSVSKSVARALGRKYVRISLGGIHDEADIRGHRKTYIGAMEGRIMSAMKEAGVKNPLVLLDEIDKMGVDYKGDPSAALLEVLDSEQNNSFRDHYIEIPFDLSQAVFMTTANTLETISAPLLDRMEIIELSGYTGEEKFNIAKNYLVSKALKKCGLGKNQFSLTDEALYDIINYYTREAGVRKLEQKIEELCRKAAKVILSDETENVEITSENISKYLGKRKYLFDMMNDDDQIGVARGLAWTSVGGDTLSIETNVMKGSGKVELTGKLGDVMKESAMAAISYIRSRAEELEIESDFYKDKDIHIHVPEGAVPKDGPSAGITMATALVSSLTGRPVRHDVAMTGEITLRGRVLPIGGLKEKTLAAYRAGIRTIIIPEENRADLDDIPKDIREEINFVPASGMDTVLETALSR